MDHHGLQKKLIVVHGVGGDVRRTYWVKPQEQETLRFSSGEQVRVKNPGVHPRENIRISYGMLSSKKANRGVDEAVASIGKVHNVPKDLYKIPMKVTGSLGGANGVYKVWQPWGGNEINVSKHCAGPAGTAAHEYGHFLDHHLFGTGKPEMRGLGTARRSKELAGVMNAIYKSGAVKQLAGRHNEFVKQGHINGVRCTTYLLDPAELFARSYAQWVGARAGGAVRSDVKHSGDEWRRLGNLHAQWDDKDFEPIAREFDRLFENRGLRPRRRAR